MFLPVSEVEPRSLVKMVPVHHSSTKQLNLELGEREETRTYNYDRGRGGLGLSQNKILLCFPSETTILCNLCWSTTPLWHRTGGYMSKSGLLPKYFCPFMCRNKKENTNHQRGVSHAAHSLCSGIIDGEMKKKRQKQTYLVAEMLISGFCLWKSYKWLISIGPSAG